MTLEELKSEYDRDGFAVIRGFLSSTELAELTRELTSGDVDPVRFAEIEAELREILRAYPPESYYNPLGI